MEDVTAFDGGNRRLTVPARRSSMTLFRALSVRGPERPESRDVKPEATTDIHRRAERCGRALFGPASDADCASSLFVFELEIEASLGRNGGQVPPARCSITDGGSRCLSRCANPATSVAVCCDVSYCSSEADPPICRCEAGSARKQSRWPIVIAPATVVAETTLTSRPGETPLRAAFEDDA